MQLYLPIAELTVNMFLFLGMGGAVGFLSGMFGVGGGFLLTPLLIFTGIPPAVAVATVTPQIVASSTSAAISYWRRRLIDVKMTALLAAGGLVGSALGVFGVPRCSARSASSISSSRSPTSPSSARSARSCCGSRRARFWRARSGRARTPRGPAITTGSTACRSRCGSAAPSSM